MRKQFIFIAIAVFALTATSAHAQFNIKIPKIPKTEKPKTDAPKTNDPKAEGGPSAAGDILSKPLPTAEPKFMIDTVEVKVKSDNRYWKVPNNDYYTSWVPQISFDLFFDNSMKVRYNAEWFNPDGSPWFSEPLDVGTYSADGTVQLRSAYDGKLFESKAVVATGNYSVKVVNTKNNEVVFQGKFKVNKMALDPTDARRKNMMVFYVDNDWTLPTGYVGFSYTDTYYEYDPRPIVFMWFKGEIEAKDLEARLYHNGQEVTSTDNGGIINASEKTFGEGCFMKVEMCKYKLAYIYWTNFIVENGNRGVREKYPQATFTRDKPGEYTVKVFHRGTQIRETKFNIDQKGWIARNPFSSQIFLANHRVAVPVKVMGTLEKWNPSTAKIDQFYGNPLTGFSTPQ
jgi:hypothetical protein